MASPERVVLVDGSSLFYRAFFAIPGSFMTSKGQHTNAIYGFALMFRKLFAGKTPAMGAVVFDAPGPTFRKAMYADYKAQRPRMPSDLKSQLPHIYSLVELNGFPQLRVPGVEADDVIGTLTRQAREAGHEVYIIAADKDFAQLIDDDAGVRMLDTLRDVTFDAELVRKKWGVPPHQMIDYLALMGDKIDNVPGVAGVGQKTAVTLLETYGTVENILAHTSELKGKLREKFETQADIATLSKQLVTIDQHVTLGMGLADLKIKPPAAADLNKLYIDLEFYSLISAEQHDALSETDGPTDYQAITTQDALDAFLADLGRDEAAPVGVVGVFDREHPAVTPLIGLACAPRAGRARYLRIDGKGDTLGAQGMQKIVAWLADPERFKVAHDGKALWRGVERAGSRMQGLVFDVQLASFLIEPTKIIPHRIDQLSKDVLHRTVRPAKSVIGSGKKEIAFSEADPTELCEWACHLADAIVEMRPTLVERLKEAEQEAQLYERDLPLAVILGEMEVRGVRVDGDRLDVMGEAFREQLGGFERQIWDLAGHEFNINSTKQLSDVLFDELGLPVIKRTKSGYSTNAEVLEKLAEEHAIAQVILEYRKLAKLINTYTDVLSKCVQPETGRIHTTFQQTTGATGRLITTDPDLQRTPIHTPEGKRIRECFIAEPGHKLISADWSQIELRILAHVSEDPVLVDAFTRELDIHARTASELFDVPMEAVEREQRNVGKTVNFATIYGQGATALSQSLKIPRKQAKAYIEEYFRVYSGVRSWLDRTIERALETGYVETLNGRRRYIPELRSNSFMEKQAGMRMAANTPIQGSAADLCKDAMRTLYTALRKEGLKTRMLMQIHDELVFEAPIAEVDAASALIREHMERPRKLHIPLVVDVGVGDSWAEAH